MSLDTILAQLGLQQRRPATLADQLHLVRRDIARLGRDVSSHLGHNAHEWGTQLGGLSHDAARQTAHLAEIAGAQAARSARMVRRDPLPLIAVVGTGLLLARLMRRR